MSGIDLDCEVLRIEMCQLLGHHFVHGACVCCGALDGDKEGPA